MLTRNQTAVLIVLARDEQERLQRGSAWAGRTLQSLVADVKGVMGPSSAYAAVASLVKVGFITESFKRGAATGSRVRHFLSISEDGIAALEAERILIEELGKESHGPVNVNVPAS